MPKIEAVVIVLNGRSRTVPLPEPVDASLLKVKALIDGSLVELEPKRAVDLRGLRVAADRRSTTSKENLARAREGREAKRTEHAALIQGFLSKLSPPQRLLTERLFAVCGFAAQGGGWTEALWPWIASILEVAPEPWRLDFYFLKKWLASPFTAANVGDAELKKSGKSPLMARRAVARNLFVSAWEEQVGADSVLPEMPSLKRVRDPSGNHPFSVLYNRLRAGEFATRAAIQAAVAEYVGAGLLDPAEAAEADRMIESGKWLGDLAVPGV